MTTRIAMLALICVGASAIAQAQTPPSDTPPPAPKEAPTTPSNASRPSSASSPHQRDVMMKDCIAKERAANSSMSKSDAQKACREQIDKANAGH